MDLPAAIRFNGPAELEATTMWRYLLVLLLMAAPAAAQAKTPKAMAAHPDPCASDRAHRGWQAGLLHDMREPARAASTAAGGA
jgi:hypothetical protein